jgi:hypothetical protein
VIYDLMSVLKRRVKVSSHGIVNIGVINFGTTCFKLIYHIVKNLKVN